MNLTLGLRRCRLPDCLMAEAEKCGAVELARHHERGEVEHNQCLKIVSAARLRPSKSLLCSGFFPKQLTDHGWHAPCVP
jgi:hypothetical protein